MSLLHIEEPAGKAGALVDWLFLPAAAWPLWRVMQKAGNRRYCCLVGLLALMAVANGVFHASPAWTGRGTWRG